MSDKNRQLGSQPNEGNIVLPANLIEVYAQLAQKGWKKSNYANSSQDTKVAQKNQTHETQRLLLEKLCRGTLPSIKKIQLAMILKDGKVICQMYTEPFMGQFFRESRKDIGNMNLLLQEIDDYYELMNPFPKVMDIQSATRESMKKTQKLIRGVDGKMRPESGATLSA